MEYNYQNFKPWMVANKPNCHNHSKMNWFTYLQKYKKNTKYGEFDEREVIEQAEKVYRSFINGEPIDEKDLLVLQRGMMCM